MVNSAIEEGMEFPDALGESEAFLEFQERLSRVARVERPVILLGERGTGKELAARRLHFCRGVGWATGVTELCCIDGTRCWNPSFSGMRRVRLRGRCDGARADLKQRWGYALLDEIGNMPRAVQEKSFGWWSMGYLNGAGGRSRLR